MKRIIAAAVCAMAVAAALSACSARDGRVDDNNTSVMISNEDRTLRNNTSRSISRKTDSHSDNGVLHNTASMVGEVGEDVADGMNDIGSSIVSNVSDAMHDDRTSDNMDNM